MLIMTNRSIDPFTQPVPVESFRVEFISQVSIHVINDHDQEENGDMQCVNRDGE